MRIAREVMAQWSPSSEATPLSDDLIPLRDYSSLSTQDEQMRLWLPDAARQALAEICERIDVSMTLYLTEFFASYLFGIHEVMRMRDDNIGLYEAKNGQRKCAMKIISLEPEQDELGSEFDDPVPEMGKNIFALKIFLPHKIKDGLQYRANKAQVPLGRFARAMICAHLFGRDVPPKMLLNPSG
jgi:hypothetical protein